MQDHVQSGYSKRFKPGKNFWFRSVGVKLSVYHLIFMTALIIATVAALLYIEQNVILVQGYENNRKLGHSIVAELGQKVASTKTIAQNLAELSKVLDKDPALFKQIFPPLINCNNDLNIAAGGIWPEPFAFDPNLERRSFFWSRTAEGTLRYSDRYNDADKPGYHRREWYVASKYLKKSQVYWSRSHIDPDAGEPVVTCTAPIVEKDKFVGAVTIDLKLTRLNEFFREKVDREGGYVFAVDRNNKLLSFPDKKSVSIVYQNANDKTAKQFVGISELTSKLSNYTAVEEILNPPEHDINNDMSPATEALKNLSRTLATESDKISLQEAAIIASHLVEKLPVNEQKAQIFKDPILNQQALIQSFMVPSTGWRIVVVSPLKRVNALAREIVFEILKVIIFFELIVLLLMLLLLGKVVTNPLAAMSDKLKNISDIETEEITLAEESRSDEIGYLAYEFNKRSKVIKDTINKLKESNLVLEGRVKKRTEDIQYALQQVEEAKVKAEEANKSKSHFLTSVSHEIRTPMNAILGYTDLLYKEINDSRLKSFIKTIQNCGQSLLSLINDILDLSKVEAGKIALQLKAVGVRDIFSGVVNQFSDAARKKGLSLKLTIDESVPQVLKLDDHRVEQILNNLVGNAIKFMEKGKVIIHVSKYTDKGRLTFSVQDDGPGIPENKLEQIFEDFEQANNVDISVGTGLGLSITRKLVKLMNGTIEVNSKLGEGSTFTVNLEAIEKASFDSVRVVEEQHADYTFKEAHILIADDVETNIKLLSEYLAKYPFKIHRAANGVEAVKLAHEVKPDLILMDMKMPEMDGFTASKKIKSDPATKSIPIIAVTAAAMITTEKEVREVCDSYLKKPVKEKVLVKEMALFLKPAVHQQTSTVTKKSCVTESTSTENVPCIAHIFPPQFIREIIQVSEKRELTELYALLHRIRSVAVQYPSLVIDNWLKAIQSSMDNFDMEKVEVELRRVHEVVDQLQTNTLSTIN